MARGNDIGSFFERLTKRAPGGRRTVAPETEPEPDRRPRGRLRDVLRRRPGRGAGAGTQSDAVTVEYTPDLDGDPDPGEVVWAWVPYEEDPSQGKDRPVVIIGRRNSSLVGAPLTSRHDDREAQVAVGTGAWDSQGRPSYARIWRMLDVDARSVRREGAVLARDRFDRVVAAVDEYHDVRH